MKSGRVALYAVLLAGCGSPDSDPAPIGTDCASAADLEAWRASAEAHITANGVPGAAIALVCDGELVYSAGIGVVKRGSSERVDGDTRFQLASVTKSMTSAAAVSLHEDGTLSLDAPISQHLPQVGYGTLTLTDLLTHTSGFATIFYAGETQTELREQVLANASQGLWSQPGEVWNYSNVGYSVAGLVVQEAAGADFRDVVEQRVFVPSGMTRATMHATKVVSEGNYAFGHSGSSVISPTTGYIADGAYGPMGGAWASATDLAHWSTAHFDGTSTISKAGFDRMMSPLAKSRYAGVDYGLGHEVIRTDPVIVEHSGSVIGYLAYWSMAPEKGFAAIALVNSEAWFPYEIVYEAYDRWLPWEFLGADPVGTPNEYVGSYDDTFDLGPIQVFLDGSSLKATFSRVGYTGELVELYPGNYTFDHPTYGEIDVGFWYENGAVTHLVSLWGVAKRQ